jgi:hypothetical protein
MNKKYSLSRAFKDALERGVLGAEELDRHCEIAKSGAYQHIHDRNARETDTTILALRMTQGGGSDGPNKMARTQSFYAPFDEVLFTRDLEVSGSAGATVGWRPPQLDKSLQPGSVVEYCSLITGLRGVAPIVDAAPTPVTWPGEAATITESDQVFSRATMKPHLVAGQVKVSKQLLLIGAPGLDAYLRNEIARSIFSQLSQKILTGTGTGNDPVGIANVTGVNSVTLTPSWAQIVECETNTAAANITEFGKFAYAVNPTQLGTQKQTAKGANLFGQLTDVDGRTNGFPTLTTTALNSGPKLIAGPFDWILVGIWGSGVELTIDEWTQAGNGLVVITPTLFCDVLVRYPGAFTIGN